MKRWMKIAVAALLVLVYCAVFMQGFAYSTITEEELDAFLQEKGMMEMMIRRLPFDVKRQIYFGELEVAVGDRTYGIFTDHYQVAYTLKNGQVVMERASRAQLQELLNDEEELANVLRSKEAERKQPTPLAAGVQPEQAVRAANREAAKAYLAANREKIRSLKEEPLEAAVQSLTNWEAELACVQCAYSSDYVSQKWLLYGWTWHYSPLNVLTDKAAMSWSGNFTALSDTYDWGYAAIHSGDVRIMETGKNCTDYDPNKGIGSDINIRGVFLGNDGLLYNVVEHQGLLSVILRKRTTENSSESAVGSYFHKCVAFSPSGSLGFSGTGASGSISISWSIAYDKAIDAPVEFWAITGG